MDCDFITRAETWYIVDIGKLSAAHMFFHIFPSRDEWWWGFFGAYVGSNQARPEAFGAVSLQCVIASKEINNIQKLEKTGLHVEIFVVERVENKTMLEMFVGIMFLVMYALLTGKVGR